VIYLNPVYVAKGTRCKTFQFISIQPVHRIQSVVQSDCQNPLFEQPGTLLPGCGRKTILMVMVIIPFIESYQPEIRNALKQFNKTQDFAFCFRSFSSSSNLMTDSINPIILL
jgi:hypothetical protein